MLKCHFFILLLCNATLQLFSVRFVAASIELNNKVDTIADNQINGKYNVQEDSATKLREYVEQLSTAFEQLKLDTQNKFEMQVAQYKQDKLELEKELALTKEKLDEVIQINKVANREINEQIELNKKNKDNLEKAKVVALELDLTATKAQVDKHHKLLEKQQIYSESELLQNISNLFSSNLEEFSGNMSTAITNLSDELTQLKSGFGIMESNVKVLEVNQFLIMDSKYINITTSQNGQLSFANNTHVKLILEKCGGTINSYPNGTVKYPESGTYANNLKCRWKVERPPGVVFVIQALSIDLESGWDQLWIYTANVSNTFQWSRQDFKSHLFHTHSNKFDLIFETDSNGVGTGFVIKWTGMKLEDTCKGNRFERVQCQHAG